MNNIAPVPATTLNPEPNITDAQWSQLSSLTRPSQTNTGPANTGPTSTDWHNLSTLVNPNISTPESPPSSDGFLSSVGHAILSAPGEAWEGLKQGLASDVPKTNSALTPAQPMNAWQAPIYTKLFGQPSGGDDAAGRMREMNFGLQPNTLAMQAHWSPREAGTMPAPYQGWNLTRLWSSQSMPANLVKSATYAPILENMRYQVVSAYHNSEGIVANPTKYTPQQVQIAAGYIKKMNSMAKGESPYAATTNYIKNLISAPGKTLSETASGLAHGLVTDPELLAPIFGDATGALDAAMEGAGINTAATGAQQLTTPQGLQGGPLATSALVGAGAGALGHATLGRLLKGHQLDDEVPNEGETATGDNAAAVPTTGAKVRPDPDAPTPDEGATAEDALKSAKGNPQSPASDAVPQTDSGQPLHPYTPVDTSGNVDLAGGVTKNGRVVISKEIPQTIDVNGTTVDAHDAIAYHERVEWPLMHLDKPMDKGGVARLRQRLGGARIPKEIYAKLVAGKPLSYQEGHAIATLAENHYVQTRYDVDPEAYQKALEPFIAKAHAAAQAEGGVPTDLDEKPNRDSGELDKLRASQKGSIDKRLLAGSALAATGAVGGGAVAAMSGKKGKILPYSLAGAAAGLGLGLIGSGDISDNIGARGKEAGMFAGLKAADIDKNALERAKDMAGRGVHPHIIHNDTGFHQDISGDWMHELDDSNSSISSAAENASPGQRVPLSRILAHDSIFKNYPELRNWSVVHNDGMDHIGATLEHSKTILMRPHEYYNSENDTSLKDPSYKQVLLHEVQHVIQKIEGHESGSSPALHAEAMDRASGIPPQDYPPGSEGAKLATRAYHTHSGEVNARNTEARIDLSPEERRLFHPDMTADVPRADRNMYPNLRNAIAHAEPIPSDVRVPGEEEILDKAQSGDIKAFEHLYKTYQPYLKGWLMRSRGAQVAADKMGITPEDIAQTTFLKAWKSLPDFKRGAKFSTWLTSIAKNEVNMALRDKDEFDPLSAPGHSDYNDDGDEIKSPEQNIPDSNTDTPEGLAERDQDFQRALEKLNPQQRTAIDAIDLQGQDAGEVAQKMGMSLETFRTFLHRARASLENNVQGESTPIRSIRRLRGSTTTDSLIGLSLISGGALAGSVLAGQDHRVRGAILGALAGVGLSSIHPIDAIKSARAFASIPTSQIMSKIADASDRVDAEKINRRQIITKIGKLIPSQQSRVNVTHWLDGERDLPLTDNEYTAALAVRQFFNDYRKLGTDAGVLKDGVDTYVTHLWDQNKGPSTGVTSPAMQVNTPYSNPRAYTSLKEGKAAGLTPVTEDITKIMDVYGQSIMKAVEGRKVLDSIKEMRAQDGVGGGEGSKLILSNRKAPSSYVSINSPSLRNFKVHPAIAPEMRAYFEPLHTGPLRSAVQTINTAYKRTLFSYSLFHPMALTQLALAGRWNPVAALTDVVKSAAGATKYHAMLDDPSLGSAPYNAVKGGLKITLRGSDPVDADVSSGFYQGLETFRNGLNRAVPKLGDVSMYLPAKVNHFLDHFLWENLHAGLKMSYWDHARSMMEANRAKDLGRDLNPDERLQVNKDAANYTNNLFGGLNWLRVAEDAHSHYVQQLKLGLFSPSGLRNTELGILSPDWSTSVMRRVTGAFKEGSGVKGLFKPRTVGDLHRAFLLRSALIYGLVGNAINYQLSGHYIWQNKDPLMLDLGNGSKMQWSKALMEPAEWLLHPGQEALNKLGPIPKSGAEVALNQKYLSTSGHSPIITKGDSAFDFLKRVGYAGSQAAPIAAQQGASLGAKSATSSFIGLPIYDKTKGDLKEIRAKAARKAAHTRAMHELMGGGK